MRIFKKELKEVLDEVICDICGGSCKKEYNQEYAELIATWGYDSNKDLTQYNVDLCENCFDKTIDYLKSIRNFKPSVDVLDGKLYNL